MDNMHEDAGAFKVLKAADIKHFAYRQFLVKMKKSVGPSRVTCRVMMMPRSRKKMRPSLCLEIESTIMNVSKLKRVPTV